MRSTWWCVLAAVTFLAAPTARAGSPDLSVLSYATIVPDSELAEMRGRFAAGGTVRFFGLQLYSAWQTSDGQIMSTAMTMGANVSGMAAGAPPSTYVLAHFHREQADPETPLNPSPQNGSTLIAPTSAGAGGLESVDGIVQSIQLAGNRNNARNEISNEVSDQNDSFRPLGILGPLGEPIEISETTVARSDRGTVQSVIVDDNSLGVSIEVPGDGVALQRVSGGGFNQIAQHLRISASAGDVANLMRITFEISATGSAARVGVLKALEHLREFR